MLAFSALFPLCLVTFSSFGSKILMNWKMQMGCDVARALVSFVLRGGQQQPHKRPQKSTSGDSAGLLNSKYQTQRCMIS
jgi:hypothetical protein